MNKLKRASQVVAELEAENSINAELFQRQIMEEVVRLIERHKSIRSIRVSPLPVDVVKTLREYGYDVLYSSAYDHNPDDAHIISW